MREPDMQKLDTLVSRLVGDVGAAVTGALVVLGDHVGIFRAMADGEPVQVAELANRTGVKERYLREWLSAQAAADYICYDERTERFSLSPEQPWFSPKKTVRLFSSERSKSFNPCGWMNRRLPTHFERVRASVGMSTAIASSEGPNDSFVPVITATSLPTGFQLSMA